MKKFKASIFLFLIFFLISFLISCSEGLKNKQQLSKAYSLYEKGKNKDDDTALLEAGKIYQKLINQKIYSQERLAAVYRTLAERSLAKNQFGYSAKYFSEALKILPNSPYLRYGLGLSYANLSESADTAAQKKDFLDKAENNIRFAISKDNNNQNYHAALASLLGIHQNKYQEALKSIDTALKIQNDNVDFLFILARIQFGLGNYQKSIEAYRRIVSLSNEPRVREQANANIQSLIGMQ